MVGVRASAPTVQIRDPTGMDRLVVEVVLGIVVVTVVVLVVTVVALVSLVVEVVLAIVVVAVVDLVVTVVVLVSLVVEVVLRIVVVAEVEVVVTVVVLVSPLLGCGVVSSFRALDDVVGGADVFPVETATVCVRFVEKLEVSAVVGTTMDRVFFVEKSSSEFIV